MDVACNEGDVAGEANGGYGCGSATREARWGIKERPLAMMYAPLQEWRELYDLDTALNRGTMFSELDLPFLGSKRDFGGVKNG